MGVRLKRVYDAPAPEDGTRVLVDRLWPRGLTREQARVDLWLRDIAPSNELRKWFGHRADRIEEFRTRYVQELNEPQRQEALARLRELARNGTVTLLFAAKSADLSHAGLLAELLLS